VELKRALRASEETLRRLIEASLQGVLIVTKEYEPLLANQSCARIFGFASPAEIMTLDSIADLIASPTLARLDAFRTESLDGSGPPSRATREGDLHAGQHPQIRFTSLRFASELPSI